MRILKLGIIKTISLLLVLTSLQSLAAADIFAPGLYEISGSHSALGSYSGHLLVKSNSEVQRHIHFNYLNQEQNEHIGLQANQFYAVEQLWEGKKSSDGLNFQIRPSNVLTSYNGYSPLNNDVSFEKVSLNSLYATFQLKNDGLYTESYRLVSTEEGELFPKDTRVKLDAVGVTGSFLVNVAGWIGVNKAIKEYRKLPHFDPYRNREEFIKNQIFQIKDLTDLTFYRSNATTLRIRNKSLTPLAIGEALQRRAAYLPTLTEKAIYKQNETRSLMNELGIFEEGTKDENGRLILLRPQGDTMLWFGVYIWSLQLEAQTTKTPEAYARLKAAIESMNHLIEISPDPKLFARYIHKSPVEEVSSDPNVKQGVGKYKDYKYDSRSNNDMVKGILLAYLVAYKTLKAEDRDLRLKIAKLVQRIQQVDPIQKKSGNRSTAKGLDALWNENVDSLKAYIEGGDGLTNKLSDEFYIDAGFHIGGMANPSGTHLNLISLSTRYYLADALINKVKEAGERMYIPTPASGDGYPISYEDPRPRLESIKRSALKNIKSLAQRMSKAHFNYLNIAAYAITQDSTLRQKALESIYGLVEVPIVRSVGVMRGDLSLQPDWMYSPWPFQPWSAIKGPWTLNKEKLSNKNQRRGVFGYPIFECASMGAGYLWVDGTNDFPCGGDSKQISFSADYLWAYWMARSANLISDKH